MSARRRGIPGLAAAALLAACVSPPPGPDGRVPPDPYERSNRAVYRFNDGVDRWVLEPLATGWSFVTPEIFRVALDRAFHNLQFPGRLVANLGQGQLVGAGSETARFVLNSTVGIAGFFDPATGIGLGSYEEDFGQMFGRWGIGSGPYWMIPLLGPSNPRDACGFVFDSVLDLAVLLPGAGAVSLVNGRALADSQVELAREGALDPYVFVRDAYLQRREAQIQNRAVGADGGAAEPSEDLYELEDEVYDMPQGEDGGGGEDLGAESVDPQGDWRGGDENGPEAP